MELKSEFYYQVQDETMQEICSKFNTDKNNILRNNPNIDVYRGEWIKIKINEYIKHIVKPTENIDKICELYAVDKKELIEYNNLCESRLFIGQEIKILKKTL